MLLRSGFSLYKSPDFYNSIKPSLASIERIEQYIQELEKEERLKIDFVISSPDTENDYNSKRHKEQHFDHRSVCTGNQRSFVILPDGKVTICEELYWHPNFIIGDLTKQSILEVWNSDKAISLFNITQNDMQPEIAKKMKKMIMRNRWRIMSSKRIYWKEKVIMLVGWF